MVPVMRQLQVLPSIQRYCIWLAFRLFQFDEYVYQDSRWSLDFSNCPHFLSSHQQYNKNPTPKCGCPTGLQIPCNLLNLNRGPQPSRTLGIFLCSNLTKDNSENAQPHQLLKVKLLQQFCMQLLLQWLQTQKTNSQKGYRATHHTPPQNPSNVHISDIKIQVSGHLTDRLRMQK